jgi:hypothetical protein
MDRVKVQELVVVLGCGKPQIERVYWTTMLVYNIWRWRRRWR